MLPTSNQIEETKPSKENIITIAVLSALCIAYFYVLITPSDYGIDPKPFVIQVDTMATFEIVMKEFKEAQTGYSSNWKWDQFQYGNNSLYKDDGMHEWGAEGHADDFFLDQYRGELTFNESAETVYEPIVPSENFRCQKSWVSIRSEMNYKYLWMHAGENTWMGATATMDTPLHRKAFEMIPVQDNCSSGWVQLREGDSKGFIYMVPPTSEFAVNEWVVLIGTTDSESAKNDTRYHFLLEEDGYVLNRAAMGFINVMPEAEYSVRGHTGGWDRAKPAGREYGAMMHFQFINATLVHAAIAKEEAEEQDALQQDAKYIAEIAGFPKSSEKRVISFGLYGGKPKYTQGAIRNAELAGVYFPGWVCRYYVTSDVPDDIIQRLKKLGAEIESIPAGMGYSSGMFWRFMVASDSTVDRYIIRDVDSRLNARDSMAVQAWIASKYPVHIMRDHVNHCIVMNGGMWGGVKTALPFMKDRVNAWTSRDEYMADLHFLEQQIWPDIKHKQISHDSYCCDRYPNTKPFPTRRYSTYQHVGQVFDSEDHPRLMDIDGFIRGVPIPGSCRKQPDWIFG